MTTRIRLARGGRKNAPFYRIVVANSTSPRDGKFIEKVGTYNPLLGSDNKDRIVINQARVEYWLGTGARPSERVALFLNQLGVKSAEKYKPQFKAQPAGYRAKKKALELAAKEAGAIAAAAAEKEQAKVEEASANNAESSN